MKTLEKSIIAELKKNTNINNHSENLILLAYEIGDKNLLNAVSSVLVLHNYFEEITPELRIIRDVIYNKIKEETFVKFDNAQEIWNSL